MDNAPAIDNQTVKKPATVADLVARFLAKRGVRIVFGLPGGENVLLLEAMRRVGIRFVLFHHEASAGFAADVWGQLHGSPGVCLSTVGPGAVNLLAGTAAATLERSPMIALTAEIDPEVRSRITHMRLDLTGLYGQVAKNSISLDAGAAGRQMEEAWSLACAPPFGAVHVSLAPSVAAAQPGPAVDRSAPDSARVQHADEREAVGEAGQLLAPAHRVMLLAGLGAEMAGAREHLIRLAEAWCVPVVVTPKAKGQFPESHPLYAGCFTAYGDQPIRRELDACDLVLGIGLDGVDFVTSTWDIPTPVLNLSLWPEPDPVVQPCLTLPGAIGATIDQVKGFRSPDPSGEERADQVRRHIQVALETGWPAETGYARLRPLIAGLREFLPPDGIVTVDVGVFKLVFLQAWRTEFEKTTFVANGLSAMGYAIPGALAVQLAKPDKQVMAVVGDGALHMYLGELATLARLRLPVIVLVVVDQALALIRLKQRRSDVPVFGTEFGQTDYRQLASAFGLGYVLLDNEQEIVETLRKSEDRTRPTLVEARIHVSEYDHFK